MSPLKALTYDVARNLEGPLAGIRAEAGRLGLPVSPVRVAVRTGDTPPAERRRLAQRPPEVLATTPESLYLLLTSSAAAGLSGVEQVIVDEIHSVAATKRGAHLALTLERLEAVADSPPQRIGLSATQRPASEAALLLGGHQGGRPRPVTIVESAAPKRLQIAVAAPDTDGGGSAWEGIYPRLVQLAAAHRSTLVFANSRRLAERLAARLNELAVGDPRFATGASAHIAAGAPAVRARAHHGSMSAEQRRAAEEDLKAGALRVLVATSSLELGIDMGTVDLVVQVEAPTSATAGIQRIGRAGHRVGEPSKGVVFPKFRHDLLVAAAVAERMRAGAVEAATVPEAPLDVLAQQVVAIVAAAPGPLPVEEVLALVRRAHPYRRLPDSVFASVLDMLSGLYPSDDFAGFNPRLVWDRRAGTLTARPGARAVAVTSGGTIPDRGLFGVYTLDGSRVGELDEEMVFESRVGETFLLGATSWRIEQITVDRVLVSPAPGVPAKMPFWHGEGPGRPFELGRAVGRFTRTLDRRSDDDLVEACGLEPPALEALRRYVAEERSATGGHLASDREVVVERFRDEIGDPRLAVLSPFGARVHAPWALALRHRLGGAETVWSDDGIVVRIPEGTRAGLDSLVLSPGEVEELVVEALGGSTLFAARFRDNAARSLLLPRRSPGGRTPLWLLRRKASDLLRASSGHGSFPVVVETYRECLRDVFDLPALQELLGDIQAGRVGVADVELPFPSPFATGLVFAYAARFVYEGDAPIAERRAQAVTIDRGMLSELLGDGELSDLLDRSAVLSVEDELQGRARRARAASVEEVADLLRRVGDLSSSELAERCDPEELAGAAWQQLVGSGRALALRVGGEERLVAVEDAARYRDGAGVRPTSALPGSLGAPVAGALAQLVRRYARTHGPFTAGQVARRFGVEVADVERALDELASDGRLLRGAFGPAGTVEWCDADVLRSVRRHSAAALRREAEAVGGEVYARFLTRWHGVAPAGQSPPAGGSGRLLEALAKLEGVPLPAVALEADILPSRVRDYRTGLLDGLVAGGEVMWVGAGEGRVVLARRDRAGLVLPRLGFGGSPNAGLDGPLHEHIRSLLDRRGACFFRELAAPGTYDADLLEALWELAWAGEVTCDGLAALRAVSRRRGASRGGRGRRGTPRPGSVRLAAPPAGQGRWSLVERELAGAAGPRRSGGTEADVAVASLLLDRYGVLTRLSIGAESPPGGFSAIYPILAAMEEAGRARRGYFVEGGGGAQFALPEAVETLRSLRRLSPSGTAHVLAATDPANPFGAALAWTTPGAARQAGAHVVVVDGAACLYLSSGALVALRPFGEGWEDPAVTALVAQVDSGRWGRLILSRWPPELARLLGEAGFVPGPKGLVLYPEGGGR